MEALIATCVLAVLEILHDARVERVVGVSKLCRSHATHAVAVTFSIFGNTILMILLLFHRDLLLLDRLEMLHVLYFECLSTSVVSRGSQLWRVAMRAFLSRLGVTSGEFTFLTHADRVLIQRALKQELAFLEAD